MGEKDRSNGGLWGRRARPTRFGLLLLTALAFALAVAASPAQAAPGYKQTGEFVNSEFPGVSGAYSTGPRVAVDSVTGDVLAAYPAASISTPPGVFIFGADGTPLGQVGAGSINPGGIAIDQTNGDLYVADVSSGKIVRYTTDRSNPPTYTPDATYDGPSQGSNYGAGQLGSLLSAIAVDPSNGDLLVADSVGLRIDRFAADGTFLRSFDGAGTEAGKFTSLVDLAVAPTGQIYVIQNGSEELESGIFFKGPLFGSLVARYASDGSGGTLLRAGPVLTEARAVGVDSVTGRVVVATGGGEVLDSSRPSTPLALTVFASSGAVDSIAQYSEPGTRSVTGGVAISASTGTLYSPTAANLSGGTSSVREFTAFEVPAVSVTEPTGVTPFAAQAHGVVTPLGKATTYYFEYKSDRATGWSSTAPVELPAGEAPVSVEAELPLESATDYELRLVAEDGESRNITPILLFASSPAPPAVVTGPAVEVGAETAHVEGTVNPLGTQSTYQFEYGLTTSYGVSLPAIPGVAGTGRTPLSVGTDIEGLQPGTTYHYRLIAKGPGGSSSGEDRTFQTQSGGAPTRSFELVSPLEKANVGVARVHETAFATADGNAMFYGSNEASYPGAESTPAHPRASAVRTASGWQSRLTDPPEFNEISGGASSLAYGTLGVSADQSKALVATRAALTPGAIAGQSNVYIRDLNTNHFTLVATGATGAGGGGGDTFFGIGGEFSFYGGSSDFSTIVFAGGVNVTGPGFPRSEALAVENEYEWNEATGLSLVNVLPDGTPSTGSVGNANTSLKDPHWVSADGKRVYFEVKRENPRPPYGPNLEAGLYLREDGRTIPVSASQRAGDEGKVAQARLIKASADGRYVIFKVISEGVAEPLPLTPDAPEGQAGMESVYRFDVVTKQLTYLTSHASAVFDAVPTTGDLYYSESSSGSGKIFFSHGGSNTLIGEEVGSRITFTSISPDGRYFAFLNDGKFTAYENEHVQELYLYDSATGALSCPSCRPDGKGPSGAVQAGFNSEMPGVSGVQRHVPRFVFDDGTVLFDTPDPLVSRDVNGERDVYEYRNGHATLISDGSQAGSSEFQDASSDGSNVFIVTNQRLIPQDRDGIFDLYDARVGGGFPATEGDGALSCGVQCGTGAIVPASSPNGSETVRGSSSRPARKKRKKHSPARCTKKSSKKKSKNAGNAKCRRGGKSGQGHGKGTKGKNHGKKGAGR